MHISSVLVQTRPENTSAVRRRLHLLAGVEIHWSGADGRLILTVEAEGSSDLADTLDRIHTISGVILATPVYHHFASLDEVDEVSS